MLAGLGAGLALAADELDWFATPAAPDVASLLPPPPEAAGVDLGATGSVLASRLAAPQQKTLSPDDLSRLAAAAGHYAAGRVAEGDASLSEINNAVAREAAEWLALRSGSPALSFARLERALDENPHWSALPAIQKRAEEAMLAQRAAPLRVLSFFARREPVSPAGRAARVLAMVRTGPAEAALPLARALWRDDHLGRELEEMILEAFAGRLTQRDHRDRMEMYLFKEMAEPALRNAARAGPEHVKLAQARIAVARKAGNAAAALAAVPAGLRQDSSFIFAQAQHHRRRKEAEISAKLIASLPRDAGVLIDGDEWWVERRLIARQLLDKGLNAEAYAVAAGHAAEKPSSIIEAEWHAGWIALRFLKDPSLAQRHFTAAARHAETPISRARVAYWSARAAEAAGDTVGASVHDEAAAGQPIAYYGQLARARLGWPDLPLRALAANEARRSAQPAIGVIEALEAAGLHEQARPLALELARTLDEPSDLAQLAAIAARVGDAKLLVNLGKAAVQRGMPLDLAAFPVHGVPAFEAAGEPVERAMVHAIARQESAFDARAVSGAGARGLMQMMLPTARETARRVNLPFDAAKLTADAAYNARLGAAHLGDLLRDWRGSYILTFAAYNAGSGNVRDWIEAYGDPRQPGVDPVDWVERIPFTETRNYVQRVMENLQVYRARLGEHRTLLIGLDLRRGSRGARFAGESEQAVVASGQ